MSLTVYTIEQAEQWDAVVRSFEDYDVYWLSGYSKAFQIHGDGSPMMFYFETSDTRGINVVMKRDVAKDKHLRGMLPEGKFFDVATPYGYGGWLIEGDDIESLFKEYASWLEQNGVISEFVRFHPMVKNQEKVKDFYEVIRLGEVVHMDLSSPETIWNGITSKNRNVIRKALKNDVRIYNGRYPEIFQAFRTIYNATMDKDNAEKYYYFDDEFYKSIMYDLPQNAQVFWAEQYGKIIAASIMMAANGHMNYHLSGSLKEYSSLAPTNLLLYNAALWGFSNGYKTLYLGGGVGSEKDSLFKFKRAFYKGALNHFYVGKRIICNNTYRELTELRGETKTSYFPAYRG